MSLVRHSFFYVTANCHTCVFYMGSWLNEIQLILSIRNTIFLQRSFHVSLDVALILCINYICLSITKRVAVQSVHYL